MRINARICHGWRETMVNENAVTQALDSAIYNVVLKEINTCFRKIERNERIETVCNALRALADLAQGSHPNYNNPMTALLYTSWYQPKQINLVYSTINEIFTLRKESRLILSNNNHLDVTDFGCGALATQFAIAFAVADALDRNDPVSSVHVNSYDTSKTMILLGKKIWRCFQIEADRDPKLETLSKAMRVIKYRASTAKTVWLRKSSAGDTWLSAIHAVYGNNTGTVRNQLAEISKDKNPDVGIITSFSSKLQLVFGVSPFSNSVIYKNPEFAFHSTFPEVTALRQNLRHHLHTIASESGTALQTDRKNQDITWFLDTLVDWQFRPAVCQIYTKRS